MHVVDSEICKKMEFRVEESLSKKVSREEMEALKKDELLKLADYFKVRKDVDCV